jgi:hypothetical protein
MKKLITVLALLTSIMIFSCTVEEEYPNPPQSKEISLSFDRFITDDISFGRSAADFVHILSPSARAHITVSNVDKPEEDIDMNIQFDQIEGLTLTLTVGNTYIIDLVYDAHHQDNGLSFNGTSDPVLILSTTTNIEIPVWTNECVVLLDKEGIGSTVTPKFSDGSLKPDGTGQAWLMFDSPLFWYVYIEAPTTTRYIFQYSNAAEQVVNIEIPSMEPETIYLLSETEIGTTTLTFKYDDIFGNLIVVGN